VRLNALASLLSGWANSAVLHRSDEAASAFDGVPRRHDLTVKRREGADHVGPHLKA
jgi:hypothetical protein